MSIQSTLSFLNQALLNIQKNDGGTPEEIGVVKKLQAMIQTLQAASQAAPAPAKAAEIPAAGKPVLKHLKLETVHTLIGLSTEKAATFSYREGHHLEQLVNNLSREEKIELMQLMRSGRDRSTFIEHQAGSVADEDGNDKALATYISGKSPIALGEYLTNGLKKLGLPLPKAKHH